MSLSLANMSPEVLRERVVAWTQGKAFTLKSSPIKLSGKSLLNSELDVVVLALSAFFADPSPTRDELLELLAFLKEDVTAPPSSSSFSSDDVSQEEVAENFFKDYSGEAHIQLIAYAKDCLEAFRANSEQVLAAYIAFVQSSGYGKTRALMEASKIEKLVYICVRPEQSTGFPSRNFAACTFLQVNGGWATKRASAANLELSLRLIAMYSLAISKDSALGTRDGGEAQFKTQCAEFWTAAEKVYQSLHAKARDVPEASKSLNAKAQDVPTKPLTELVSDEGLVNRDFVLLAIDEASCILDIAFPGGKNMFRAMRAVMRELQLAGINMVLVLTDTYSNISSFLPAVHFDSSQRPHDNQLEGGIRGLFASFILHSTFDALRNTKGLGRPLVAEHCLKTRFLQSKLAGTNNLNNINSDGMLALMLIRVAVHISPQSRVCERLVASHMGTALASSAERDCLLVTYLSEPPLAAAASQLWDSQLARFLSVLRETLTTGAVSAGSAGEIVAQIVLLVAFDSKAPIQVRYSKSVPLKAFLGALLPQTAKEDASVDKFIPKQHCAARISVLQFVQLPGDFEFTDDALKELYVRQTAAVLPVGQPGADLLIPYFVESTNEYSFVLVQVKNWAKASDFAAILEKLTPEVVFEAGHAWAAKQCVRICMHLGDDSARKRNEHGDKYAQQCGAKALETYSVDFACMAKRSDVVDGLKHLLSTSNDVVEFMDSADAQIREKGFPVPGRDLNQLPFVCGTLARRPPLKPVEPTHSCCKCTKGDCQACNCGKNKVRCLSTCNSTRCNNKAAKLQEEELM